MAYNHFCTKSMFVCSCPFCSSTPRPGCSWRGALIYQWRYPIHRLCEGTSPIRMRTSTCITSSNTTHPGMKGANFSPPCWLCHGSVHRKPHHNRQGMYPKPVVVYLSVVVYLFSGTLPTTGVPSPMLYHALWCESIQWHTANIRCHQCCATVVVYSSESFQWHTADRRCSVTSGGRRCY